MSENTPTFDENNEEPFQGSKRPSFLTVLCILSGIYILLGLIGSIQNSFTNMEAQQEQLDQSLEMISDLYSQLGVDENLFDQINNYIQVKSDNLKFESLLNLVFLLIEGIGVYFMFLLQRRGFFVYLGAQVGFVIIPVIIQGLNMFSMAEMGVGLFFSGLFVLLYGLNLKHLT
tara:strand:+ start:82 stop:600 length:519 start_codon:yes stop_codon:yes gene_type:complete